MKYFYLIKQENIVDSRFKLLAADFWDQLDGLKGKVVRHEETKTTNGLFETQNHHEVHKRQTNVSKYTPRPVCENSSSLCTFFYHDHPDASGRKRTLIIGNVLYYRIVYNNFSNIISSSFQF